jgi:hypothetical protein
MSISISQHKSLLKESSTIEKVLFAVAIEIATRKKFLLRGKQNLTIWGFFSNELLMKEKLYTGHEINLSDVKPTQIKSN